MINPIQALTEYSGNDWHEYLDTVSLQSIFKDLIDEYQGDADLLKGIIRYIVWTYSKDSPKITLGSDWTENKKRIFEAAQLPPMVDVLNDVVNLKKPVILITIKNWIDYQNDDVWKELKMLKDLKSEMQLSANSAISTGTIGQVNYDQKFKNAKYSMELATMIKDCESKLLQNDVMFKEMANEIRTKSKSNINLSPETFAK